MIITVAALQYPLGEPMALEDILHLFRRRPDIICLPEYFGVRSTASSHHDGIDAIERQMEFYAQLSSDLQCTVIGGTIAHPVAQGFANVATVFDQGEMIGSYQKTRPTESERKHGIIPGEDVRVFDVHGIKIGLLICADVLDPESFASMDRLNADVIFVPTISPYLPTDTVFAKDRRDTEIFVAGARRAKSYIVKVCGIGTIFGNPLQGRSGFFAPWGIQKRVMPDSEQKRLILTENLDIDDLREFRRLMGNPGMSRSHPGHPRPPVSSVTPG